MIFDDSEELRRCRTSAMFIVEFGVDSSAVCDGGGGLFVVNGDSAAPISPDYLDTNARHSKHIGVDDKFVSK